MLSLRLIVSAILIPLVIALFVADARLGPNAPIFGLISVLVGAMMASEMVSMYRGRFPKLSRVDVIIAVAAVIGIGWACHAVQAGATRGVFTIVDGYDDGRTAVFAMLGQVTGSGYMEASHWLLTVAVSVGYAALFVLLMSIAWMVIAAIRVERGTLEFPDVVPTISIKLFIVAYVGGFTSLTSQIRWLGSGANGLLILATVVIATKTGDIGAYFTGRFLGKKNPLPKLSPKKTGAGFIGAPVVGGLATLAWLTTAYGLPDGLDPFDRMIQFWSFFAIGVVLALIGLIGDLAESIIKRSANVKDASNTLPGFGGVLDLLDSIIFTGAFTVCAATALIYIGMLFA